MDLAFRVHADTRGIISFESIGEIVERSHMLKDVPLDLAAEWVRGVFTSPSTDHAGYEAIIAHLVKHVVAYKLRENRQENADREEQEKMTLICSMDLALRTYYENLPTAVNEGRSGQRGEQQNTAHEKEAARRDEDEDEDKVCISGGTRHSSVSSPSSVLYTPKGLEALVPLIHTYCKMNGLIATCKHADLPPSCASCLSAVFGGKSQNSSEGTSNSQQRREIENRLPSVAEAWTVIGDCGRHCFPSSPAAVAQELTFELLKSVNWEGA